MHQSSCLSEKSHAARTCQRQRWVSLHDSSVRAYGPQHWHALLHFLLCLIQLLLILSLSRKRGGGVKCGDQQNNSQSTHEISEANRSMLLPSSHCFSTQVVLTHDQDLSGHVHFSTMYVRRFITDEQHPAARKFSTTTLGNSPAGTP